jgi:hypothetical protein
MSSANNFHFKKKPRYMPGLFIKNTLKGLFIENQALNSSPGLIH